ncbi:hypothetical protein NKR23_g9700 [Pleurostoma richardsiae]|uniref:Uncharacterized protein n=1 Tax=Pleurostoma richardsiae TaxID=41990 RepID=A0AA38VEQ0_9PEZI|nr:hypothetical protein NKR23_g9700 [Pleurostoma richardsiae]
MIFSEHRATVIAVAFEATPGLGVSIFRTAMTSSLGFWARQSRATKRVQSDTSGYASALQQREHIDC